jgi:hypothetical protein
MKQKKLFLPGYFCAIKKIISKVLVLAKIKP